MLYLFLIVFVQISMSVLLIMEAVNMNVLTLLALTSFNAELDSCYQA